MLRIVHRHLVPLLALLSLVALAPEAGAEPTATPVAGIAEAGESIARGPGGTMWVAQSKAPGRVIRIDADGTRTDFTGGTTPNFPQNRRPSGVVALGDGSAWFLMSGGGEELGRITPAGTVMRYVLRRGTPTSLAAGPDGALWMTADNGGRDDDDDDRTTARDAIVRYEAGEDSTARFDDDLSASTNPYALVTGADGALWFAESGGQGRVGRMTTAGEVGWYDTAGQGPITALAPGPLASAWYARADTVGPLAGTVDPFDMSPTPAALADGPDGALWGAADQAVTRFVPGQAATAYGAGLPDHARGQAIAAGPDGRMWMTLDRAPNLVRITVPPRVDAAEATPTTVQAGVRPNGLDTTVSAELLGPDGTWQSVGATAVGASTDATPVTFQLSGLTPSTDYRARLVAVNEAGTTTGAEASLRTNPAPASSPPPTPEKPPVMPAPAPGPAAVALPVKGETLLAAATSGSVKVRTPGQKSFTALDGIGSLPPGTVVDAGRGRVLLASGHERTGFQFGLFAGGRFRMGQSKRGVGTVVLDLVGRLDCGTRRSAAVASRKRRKSRKIWGLDDGGSFKTRGSQSVTTVRGTLWMTKDTCKGTRVKVLDGSVSVKPKYGKRKARIVRAGESLLTRRR